jgi:hypothetical protein
LIPYDPGINPGSIRDWWISAVPAQKAGFDINFKMSNQFRKFDHHACQLMTNNIESRLAGCNKNMSWEHSNPASLSMPNL